MQEYQTIGRRTSGQKAWREPGRDEGNGHEDRDAQFLYINDQVVLHENAGQPVISVDTIIKVDVAEPLPGRLTNPLDSWAWMAGTRGLRG